MSPAGLLSWATVDAHSIPFEWYTTKFTAFEFGASSKVVTAGQLLALVLTSESAITPDYWYLWTTRIAGSTPPVNSARRILYLTMPESVRAAQFRFSLLIPTTRRLQMPSTEEATDALDQPNAQAN